MLVIRRRAGESLLIGDNVEVEILELGPAHVKLGIRAPREITVLRNEVRVTREQNQAAAVSLSGDGLAGLLDSLSTLRDNPSSRHSPTQR